MGYLIKYNGRYVAKAGSGIQKGYTHGHPKTTLLKESAKVYATQKTAINSAKKFFGAAKFEIVVDL